MTKDEKSLAVSGSPTAIWLTATMYEYGGDLGIGITFTANMSKRYWLAGMSRCTVNPSLDKLAATLSKYSVEAVKLEPRPSIPGPPSRS